MPSVADLESPREDSEQHPEEESGASGRGARRSRNQNALEKLEKLNKLKRLREEGKKQKYEVKDVVPVFDTVTEEDYGKLVQKRQEDNWIELGVGDDAEYYDDGREIFDEEDNYPKHEKGKKGKSDRKGKHATKTEAGEKEVRCYDLPTMFNRNMMTGPSEKPKTKTLSLTLGKEVVLDELCDELNGVVHQAPKPDRRRLIYGESAINKIQQNLQKSSNVHSGFSFKPGHTETEVGQHDDAPMDFGLGPPSPLTVPVPEQKPKEVQAKRPMEESPERTQAVESVISRETLLKPKFTPITMDRPAKAAQLTTANGSAKKAKPNTPVKAASFESDWAELDLTDDFEASLTLLENSALTEGLSDSPRQDKAASRIPVARKDFTAVGASDKQNVSVDFDEYLPDSGSLEGERKFYWLDAYEDAHHEGCVFLFGIFKEDVSPTSTVRSCIKVEGIQRRIYFCLREGAVMDDLKADVAHIMRTKLKVSNYREMEVIKSYAFEKTEVPSKVQCLELRYSFKDSVFPEAVVGDNISHIFGRNTSALEIFLLDRKLRGPSWLNIAKLKAQDRKISFCKNEFTVEKPVFISIVPNVPAPPVTIMAIHLRIVVDSKTKQSEIIGAALLWGREFPLDNAVNGKSWDDHLMLLAETKDAPFPGGINGMEKIAQSWKKKGLYKVDVARTERELLSLLFTRIHTIDPDFIIFHDAVKYQLGVLVHRAQRLGLQNWSRLGRLHRTTVPKGRNALQVVTAGRLVVDVKLSAQELVHLKNYDLSELVSDVLREKRDDLDSDLIKEMYRSPEHVELLVKLTLIDAEFVLRIMTELDTIPLALQITKLAGNILSRTLMGGRAERNEFLLLHAFTEKGYVCPDKEFKIHQKRESKKAKPSTEPETLEEDEQVHEEETGVHEEMEPDSVQPAAATTGKRKPAYAGGLVLEPKKGLHDHFILLMDFNSLYPSIIQEYNICFTTVDRSVLSEENADVIPELPDKLGRDETAKRGVLPAEIYRLVEDRKAVKSEIKAETERNKQSERLKQLEIRQKALKLTANSMYGCLGFTSSRFYARPLAALITSKGREILQNTKELVEKLGLEVIYGDTDSIMINTHLDEYDKVLEKGNEIRAKVGKQYNCLELGIDGIFRKLLLLQKKKYAALVAKREKGEIKYYEEFKGLEIVRRDWSELARQAGSEVVNQILSIQGTPETLEKIQGILRNISEKVNSFSLSDVDLYVITRQLTKDPSKYHDAKSLPHVQVALRWNESVRNAKKLLAGDYVRYVICNEVPATVVAAPGQKIPHTQRAYHVEELVSSNSSLTIDKQYYLAEQVHKVVNRMCEYVEGLDSATIAQLLGVDRAMFPHHFIVRVNEDDTSGAIPDSELYRNCQSFQIVCPQCSERWDLSQPVYEKDGKFFLSLSKCVSCDEIPMNHFRRIQNTLVMEINRITQRYYNVELTCENINCHFQCNFMPNCLRGRPLCPECRQSPMRGDFTERDLYFQLSYWRNGFDPLRTVEKIKNQTVKDKLKHELEKANNGAVKDVYDMFAGLVKSHMDQSAYAEIRLESFFPRNIFAKLNLNQNFKEL